LDRPALVASEIAGMGLILADGIDGRFDLTLAWIEFDYAPMPDNLKPSKIQ
jgi:hypothetical protein